MLADLPADIKKGVLAAMLDMHAKSADAFKKLTDGKAKPYLAVENAAFDPVGKLIKFVDGLRKKS
jgi:phosphonate transport system substrate-binding protein